MISGYSSSTDLRRYFSYELLSYISSFTARGARNLGARRKALGDDDRFEPPACPEARVEPIEGARELA